MANASISGLTQRNAILAKDYFFPMMKRLFHRGWFRLALILLLCSLIDLGLVAALPYLGLSYGPIWPPVLLLLPVHAAVLIGMGVALHFIKSERWRAVPVILAALLQAGIFVLVYDVFYIEPFRLTVTRLPVPAPAFLPDRDLRILQITDVHVERLTVREQDVLVQVENLQPDIIVLTGDYFNASYLEDPLTFQQTKAWLAQLKAPYGVYAINGNVNSPFTMRDLFAGLQNIRVLNNEVFPLHLPGGNSLPGWHDV